METISMRRKERGRLEAMSRVKAGALSLGEAAELLRVSYRQVKRIWSRYQARGDAGRVHGLRGKASNRKARASCGACGGSLEASPPAVGLGAAADSASVATLPALRPPPPPTRKPKTPLTGDNSNG